MHIQYIERTIATHDALDQLIAANIVTAQLSCNTCNTYKCEYIY